MNEKQKQAYDTMVALFDWLRQIWAKRDPLYISDEELEESRRRLQAERERESKRREALEGDEELMVALKHVARTVFAIPKEASFVMAGQNIRVLQIPIAPSDPIIPPSAKNWDLLRKPVPFHAENIELRPYPSWLMGKFYDFSMGYGPESKLVAWRVGNYQW